MAFELWLTEFYRNDCGHTFANIFAKEVVVFFFQQTFVAGVLVEHRGKSCFETFNVHAAFGGGNTVGIAVNTFVITGVPLHGHVGLHAFFFVFFFKVCNLGEERFFRRVQVFYKVNNAAFVLVRNGLLALGTMVGENNFEAFVQKCHGLQTLGNGTSNELNTFGGKNCWVWIERDRGSVCAVFDRCGPHLAELSLHFSAINKLELVTLGIAINFHQHPC